MGVGMGHRMQWVWVSVMEMKMEMVGDDGNGGDDNVGKVQLGQA